MLGAPPSPDPLTPSPAGAGGRRGRLRLDLGVRALLPEWAALLGPQGLKEDLLAGLTVACIAVPLSLAIALASGVAPGAGLIAAIVGSAAAALLGGTPLAISGPAAAMAVLIASVVQEFGLGGLLLVGFGCGALQLLTGILGYGQLARFVPMPVVAGFTAGIGAIIFIGQLPRALGLPPPDQSHVVQVVLHIRELLRETQPVSLLLACSTVALIFGLPKVLPRLPAPFIGVLAPSLVVFLLKVDTATLGAIPSALPAPSLPALPVRGLGSLAWTTGIVFALASLETLLSSSAVDKLAKGPRHDPDQELIGQGVGNLLTALFGGLPITGVIARSALNVQAGARSRRAALVHALVLLAAVYALAPVLARIPLAVLAGVLLSVSLRMLNPAELMALWRTSRAEAATYLVTFAVIVFVDLIAGIQAGLVAALVIMALRAGRSQARFDLAEPAGPTVITINGSLTFLATTRLDAVRASLERVRARQGVVFDLSGVTSIDSSGGLQLLEILETLTARKAKFAIKGLAPPALQFLRSLEPAQRLPQCFAHGEQEVMRILDKDPGTLGRDRLIYGVERFRRDLGPGHQSLFRALAQGQHPHTLFITCADSRINPNLITSTEPGELFIIRNIGNLVPAFGAGSLRAEAAGVEFAVALLGVREIVLCGHSGCGAMKAILAGEALAGEERERLPSLCGWLEETQGLRRHLHPGATVEQAARRNILLQLENLKTHPLIQARLAEGTLRLHAWFYDIGEAQVEAWDETLHRFAPLASEATLALRRRTPEGSPCPS